MLEAGSGRKEAAGSTKVMYIESEVLTMNEIRWTRDVDAALKEAKSAHKPVLLDFSAAPA